MLEVGLIVDQRGTHPFDMREGDPAKAANPLLTSRDVPSDHIGPRALSCGIGMLVRICEAKPVGHRQNAHRSLDRRHAACKHLFGGGRQSEIDLPEISARQTLKQHIGKRIAQATGIKTRDWHTGGF